MSADSAPCKVGKTGGDRCVLHVSFEKPIRYSKGDLVWAVTVIVWSLKRLELKITLTLRIEMSMIIYSGCG